MPALTPAERAKLRRAGLARLDRPKFTPSHPTKKAVVATRVAGKGIRIIRFGAKGYPHNYSADARRRFRKRHARNIARGRASAAYWANAFLWSPSGHVLRA